MKSWFCHIITRTNVQLIQGSFGHLKPPAHIFREVGDILGNQSKKEERVKRWDADWSFPNVGGNRKRDWERSERLMRGWRKGRDGQSKRWRTSVYNETGPNGKTGVREKIERLWLEVKVSGRGSTTVSFKRKRLWLQWQKGKNVKKSTQLLASLNLVVYQLVLAWIDFAIYCRAGRPNSVCKLI